MVFLSRTVGVGCGIGTTREPMWPSMVCTQLAETVPLSLHCTLWMPQPLVETLVPVLPVFLWYLQHTPNNSPF